MLSQGHRRSLSAADLYRIPHRQTYQTWVKVVRFLLPSFVSDVVFPEHRPTWRLHPTSYLDGLRGVAAVIVFFCHYTENNFSALTPSYGLDPKMPPSWIQLPYLRIIFSGRPMVHIFFVISGFALSYKPVKALYARDISRCHTALASSAFRRPFRLFGPCIVSTFFILCLRRMGYLDTDQQTLTEELRNWKAAVAHQITWPWAWDRDLRPDYDVHLWTIPIEFAHSMLLFMTLLALSRVRCPLRLAAVWALMLYCLSCGRWAGFEFLAGLFLAEIHVLRSGRAAKEWESDGIATRPGGAAAGTDSGWMMRTFQLSLVLLGLFIGGWPNEDADKTPGIRYFLAQTPLPFARMDRLAPQKFWFGLSAVAMVWAVGELDCLRAFFEGPLAQYCGRISYAVYICHGPVEELFRERLLGHPLVPSYSEPDAPDYRPALPATGVKGFLGIDTMGQITVSWFVGLWLLGPLVIWAADLFWRLVDNPIVGLAKRAEALCLDDTEPSPGSHGYSVVA